MDGADNICPCLSGHPYDACCGPFRDAPAISGEVPLAAAHGSLRRQLLILLEQVPELQEIWFSFADDLPGPLHDALPGIPLAQLEQPRLELFLWDYFQKVSLARPILRVARNLELDDLRLASRLDDWSLSPWSCWQVESRTKDAWNLRSLSNGRLVHAHTSFAHHEFTVGDGLVARLLQHGGHTFTGLGILRFAGQDGAKSLEIGWKDLCLKMGLSPSVTLRPDVHNEQWFAFHRNVLELWAGIAPLRKKKARARKASPPQVMTPPDLDVPLAELANQSPRAAAAHAMGRHRLKHWLAGVATKGIDIEPLRKELGLD